ncbi:MAG: right-handed parallel beta-helix repeat-containing protein, partial [Bacteroidia bacterium]|nr:right-handed parallel beta-helix repeat-containing protein [Bacteroidia bacterium]
MKKIYNSNWLFKLKTAAVLCSMLFAGTAMAQLSGTYSIDGGGTGDFTTFTQLADTLNSDGVSGPVIVNVAAGTYAQNFSILNVTGLSTTNSLTINGGGATISSSNDVITLRGVSGVNIDNLKIECNGTSSKNVWIYNGGTASPSSNISITNCELTKPNGSLYATASAYVKIGSGSSFSSNASQNNTDITIEDNLMHGGSTSSSAGVYCAISNNHPTSAAADQNVVIRNNDISGWRYYGVYTRYTSGLLLQGNEIHNPANIPQQYKYAIYIYNNDYSSEYAATEKNVVDKNWIHDLGSSTTYYYQYGLYYYNYYGYETNDITNNVFHMNSQSSFYGISYRQGYNS